MLLKLLLSVVIIIISFIFIIMAPAEISLVASGKLEYIVDNRIDEYHYAQDNPIVKGLEYEQNILKGKSISERNKLLYSWRNELRTAKEKAVAFNKSVVVESGVMFDNHYYIYIRVFSILYIICFSLIAYFIKFYKWYDSIYLFTPFYIIVFGEESVIGIEWLIILFLSYFIAIYLKTTNPASSKRGRYPFNH